MDPTITKLLLFLQSYTRSLWKSNIIECDFLDLTAEKMINSEHKFVIFHVAENSHRSRILKKHHTKVLHIEKDFSPASFVSYYLFQRTTGW